jgi:hypothetical protein
MLAQSVDRRRAPGGFVFLQRQGRIVRNGFIAVFAGRRPST